ncbi:MAG: DUF4276 family protein [Limnothrix sp. RL_2_0]|nr:DUF4276 family protein [Limnothrix sp. RL_2_0]
MNNIRYTLLTDGSSDKSLMSIIDWLLESLEPEIAIQSEWADLGRLRTPPKKLSDRIVTSLDLYPCDLLFIHRDAENQPMEKRISEIDDAIKLINSQISVEYIPIIPIRMTEAWLLIDESAIRQAAGNPRGKNSLNLPLIKKIESISDPKVVLQNLLKEASNLPARRRQSISNHRVATLITDFSPLEALSAFQKLKLNVIEVLERISAV